MKKIIYILGTCACMLSSCNGDYLDVKPTELLTPDEVFSTTSNAQIAVDGLGKLMASRYINQNFSGEGTIRYYFGTMMGNDTGINFSSYNAWFNMTFANQSAQKYNYFPWFYYYKIISNANSVICNIDKAEGTTSERNFIKAEALTYRAYCYSMLVQFYGNRWSDSNDGSTSAVVLRLDESYDALKLSTLKECYEQIYKDCDEAIKLFTESSEKRENIAQPNINVAYAIKAKAALTREDWSTATENAVKAREGFKLMSNEDYYKGFNTANDEWIWQCRSTEALLGYYSYFAFTGSNSSASNCYKYPKWINKSLFDKIPDTDIRKKLFLDPKNYKAGTATDKSADYLATTGQSTATMKLYKDTWDNDFYASRMCPTSTTKSYVYAYMQFKIQTRETPGIGDFNLIRASEMYLVEAEALCHVSGRDADVQKVMNELIATSGRDEAYNCTATGDALLDEVKTYRRIELWGEGYDWFDLKRWGEGIKRTSYAKGGNFTSGMSITVDPEDYEKWTYSIPNLESDYNTALKPE